MSYAIRHLLCIMKNSTLQVGFIGVLEGIEKNQFDWQLCIFRAQFLSFNIFLKKNLNISNR